MKILYIDDEEINTRLMGQAAKLLGTHDYCAANSATEGLKVLDSGYLPDLILLDINLPDISGLVLVTQLRQRFPEMPIVAITAYAFPGDREKCQQAGFSDYIPKPLKVDLIKDLLAKYGN